MTRYRITALKVVALICFASSGSSATPRHLFQQARLATVQLCDLLRYPGRYKNKIVRVRVVYNSWFEGSELMKDCPDDEGGVWAYFPDSVYSQSKPEIAERLEDVFFRYLPDASPESPGTFKSFQTELIITGQISRSKKKAFGIHGGFAYLFTIATVEEIGTTQIHDHETGKTTAYTAESSEQRQARHAREAALVCESNSLALDKVLTEFESSNEEITLEAKLGKGERSSDLNHLRLATIRDYFINCAGVPSEKIIVREGERSRFEGRVNVYRAGKRSKILLAGTDMNICLKPCASPPNKALQLTAR